MRDKIPILIISLATLLLTACGSIPDAGKVLIGSAQLTQTSSVRDTLLDYLPAESEAVIARDLAYLDDLYDQFKDVQPDVSVVTLALDSPDAFDRIGESFASIRGEVMAYKQHSGIPIPVDLVAYSAGTIPAYTEIRSAIRSNDTALRAVEVVRLLKPLAALVIL